MPQNDHPSSRSTARSDTARPARLVEGPDGLQARTPKRNHLLGVFNEKGQLVIKRGDELVIVEVPNA